MKNNAHALTIFRHMTHKKIDGKRHTKKPVISNQILYIREQNIDAKNYFFRWETN
jgi:hypothetical protein